MNTRLFPRIILSTIFLFSSIVVSAQNQLTVDLADPTMSLDQVKPGLRGYGKTVFTGVSPERFYFTVLGVIHNSKYSPTILVKLDGGPQNIISRTGVIAGMSGSPMYSMDGRLIGALAATFPLEKEAEGLVQPIDFMTGFVPKILNEPNMYLGPATIKPTPQLVPGEAYAYFLLWGDLNAYSIATITAIDKNKDLFVAQGHGGLNVGKTAVPFARAIIYKVIPNVAVSFKMGEPTGGLLGTIILDGPYGQIGKLGVFPKNIPIAMRIDGFLSKPRSYHCFAAYTVTTPDLIANLIKYVSSNGIQNPSLVEDATIRIKIKDLPEIVIKDAPDRVASLTQLVLDNALNNFTHPSEVEYISLDVIVRPVSNEFWLNSGTVSKDTNNKETNQNILKLKIENELNHEILERGIALDKFEVPKDSTLYLCDYVTLMKELLSAGDLSKVLPMLNRYNDQTVLYIVSIANGSSGNTASGVSDNEEIGQTSFKNFFDSVGSTATPSTAPSPLKYFNLKNIKNLGIPGSPQSSQSPERPKGWSVVELEQKIKVLGQVRTNITIKSKSKQSLALPAENNQKNEKDSKDPKK